MKNKMSKSNKVGLITYHAAYNFGSMLQAYATQEVIREIGFDCLTINYRMKSQKSYYDLFRTDKGLIAFGKDILLLPWYKDRKKSNEIYENFLKSKVTLTEECEYPQDVYNIWNRFNVIVSGSDQIWNKHSFELENCDFSYMFPFLLTGFSGKKVSYASSIGGMSESELELILPELRKFDHISVRELSAKERIQKKLKREITEVLDPTLILSSSKWIEKLGISKIEEEPYILYYTLRGYKKSFPRISILKKLSKIKNCKIKIITPSIYIPYFDSKFQYLYALGPIEFIEQIYNAKMVISESYHGTIFSINFNKDIYSLCGIFGAEYRKIEILKKLGMDDRIIFDIEKILDDHKQINYGNVNRLLDLYRTSSIEYLKKSLMY